MIVKTVSRRRPRSGSVLLERKVCPTLPGAVNDQTATKGTAPVRLARAARLGHRPAQTYTVAPMPLAYLSDGPAPGDLSATVQRKRELTKEPDKVKQYLESGDRGDETGEKDDLKTVEGNYAASFGSGLKLLDYGLDWYLGKESAKPPIKTEKTRSSIKERGYKDFWFVEDDSIVICTHRGKSVKNIESGKVSGYAIGEGFFDDQSFMYSNSYDLKTGTFHASINYKNWDDSVAEQEKLPPALPNSEIIWHQYQLALKIANSKKPATLRQVSRESIGNTQTLDTIFLTDQGDRTQKGQEAVVDEPVDDAWALLGTPNGRSSVWLLIQHSEDFGGVDIEKIVYKSDSLEIHFITG